MNNSTALDILKHPQSGDTSDIKEAIGCAISALEKQIPKKPNIPWDTQRPQCPICQSGFLGEPKYCDECGQALDWSDTNDR